MTEETDRKKSLKKTKFMGLSLLQIMAIVAGVGVVLILLHKS